METVEKTIGIPPTKLVGTSSALLIFFFFLQWLDKDILNSPAMTKILLGDRPNTYTLTKV
jgi:hypothetical protein